MKINERTAEIFNIEYPQYNGHGRELNVSNNISGTLSKKRERKRELSYMTNVNAQARSPLISA